MITNPKSSPENEACKDWLANLASKGVEVVIPEIADYEVRRELLRAGKERGLGRLDALKGMLGYAPITTTVMLKAAEFWATARRIGRQSAADASLGRRHDFGGPGNGDGDRRRPGGHCHHECPPLGVVFAGADLARDKLARRLAALSSPLPFWGPPYPRCRGLLERAEVPRQL